MDSMDSMDFGDDLIQGKLFALLPLRSTHLSACLFWGLARDDSFGVGAPILSLENLRQVWQVI